MKRVFIVYGYTSDLDKDWGLPWFKAELEKLGAEVTIPEMPTQLNEWLPHLQNVIGPPDEETYLVGHSLGRPTILRYLESLDDGQKVGGVLLLTGFAEKLPESPELDSFSEDTWDDEHIKASADKIIIVNSDYDPDVPLANGEWLRDRFGAELVTVHAPGRITEESGISGVPYVFQQLKKMMETLPV